MIKDNGDQSVTNVLRVVLFSYDSLVITLYISQWLGKSTKSYDIKELLFHNFTRYDKYFLILFLLNAKYAKYRFIEI